MHPLSRRGFLAASAAATLCALPTPAADEKPKKKKLILLPGRPSHGPGAHEFNAGVWIINKCLEKVEGLEVVTHRNGWPDNDRAFADAAGILSFTDGGNGHPLIQEKRLATVADFMKRGVGLMCAHYGVEVPKDKGGAEFLQWIGGYYEHQYSCNPMWTPNFTEFPRHAITQGVRPFAVRDEWYFNIRFREGMKGVTPILSAKPSDAVRDGPYVYPKGPYKHVQDARGKSEAMMWATERPDGGRGVGFTGGHFHANWKDDNFRKVVLNALLWICKVEVPRDGVASTVSDDDMKRNLDDKPKKK